MVGLDRDLGEILVVQPDVAATTNLVAAKRNAERGRDEDVLDFESRFTPTGRIVRSTEFMAALIRSRPGRRRQMESNSVQKNAVVLAKRLWKEVGNDDLSGAAAEMAYRFFLALFPFFIFVAAVGGFLADLVGIADPTTKIMDAIGRSMPPDSADVLRRELTTIIEGRNPTLVSFGILATIWASSSGISALTKGMNRALDVRETRPLWKRYLISLGLTAFGGIAIIGAFTIMVAGQIAGLEVAKQIGLEGAAGEFFAFARWPATALLLLVGVDLIYWVAPNLQLPFKWLTPGAFLFVIGWLVVTFLFGLYVQNLGSYGATYGTLGSIVVLLIWFYLTAFILLLGVELNAVLVQEGEPDEIPPRVRDTSARETRSPFIPSKRPLAPTGRQRPEC
jgi:membrane protein